MNQFPTMIGLTGRAGSGKDTTANLLHLSMLERADQYSLYALATPLKRFCSNVFNIPVEYFNDRDLKERELSIGLNYNDFSFRIIMDSMRLMNIHYDINGKNLNIPVMSEVILSILEPFRVQRNKFQRIADSFTGINLHYKISPRKIAQLIGTEYFRDNFSNSFWCDICPKENVIVTDVRFPEEYDMIVKNGGIIIKVENSNLSPISETGHSSEQYFDVFDADYVIKNDGINIDTLVSEVETLIKEIYKNDK